MKTLEEKIAVMQAFADGKKVRFRSLGLCVPGEWLTASNSVWNWDHFDYEVVPEPRTWWLLLCETGWAVFNSDPSMSKSIKVVEVLE